MKLKYNKKYFLYIIVFVVFVIIGFLYKNHMINENFSDVVEMLDNYEDNHEDEKKCPDGCSKDIELLNISTKLNSIQTDINKIGTTTDNVQTQLTNLEKELRSEMDKMEKEISQGVNN